MKKTAAKKLTALLLAVLALCPLLNACKDQKPAGPLRILLDVDERTQYSPTESVFEQLLAEIAEAGGPAEVEAEYLPQTGVERETAIARLRTEIMAGEGPDLFLIQSSSWWSDGTLMDDGPLFPMPEKAAVNGLFMPLDQYIEKARFAQWGDFNETVMEVGRTEQGQMIVPLSYTFPVTCFRRFEASHTPSADTAWEDMLADGSLVMRAAAILRDGSEENMIRGLGGLNFEAIFGRTADYEAEELLFSEEEFAVYAHKQLRLLEEESWESLAQLPEYFHCFAHPWFYDDGESMGRVSPCIKSGEELTVIPQYSIDGGVTASVFSYACVNASSRRGEDAFFVLDYLLGRDRFFANDDENNGTISQPSLRQDLYSLFTGSMGLPIDSGAAWGSAHQGVVSEFNRNAMDAAVRCITAVNIHDKLNKMMAKMMIRCEEIARGYEEGDVDELIAETYRVMRMELQES